MTEKAVQVTLWIEGDNENTPEEAAHHALAELHRLGRITSFVIPALDGPEDGAHGGAASREFAASV